MERVIIIGAGGHGQVVADILLRMHTSGSPVMPVGYVDDAIDLRGSEPLGIPIMGTLADLAHLAYDGVVLAIGSNSIRARLYQQFAATPVAIMSVIHPSAVIAPDVCIGPGSVICAGVVINPGTVIGANVIINTMSSIDHHNRVQDHVHVAPGAHTGGDVTIEEGVLVGIGATIMPQRTIGKWAVIGAGSVVTHNVPERVIVTGVPARVVRTTSA